MQLIDLSGSRDFMFLPADFTARFSHLGEWFISHRFYVLRCLKGLRCLVMRPETRLRQSRKLVGLS